MKGFGIALLCLVGLVLTVQGRSTGVQSDSCEVVAGSAPNVVYLSVVSSLGWGRTRRCVGSLINSGWVLTTGTCLQDASFIWIYYGAVNVINPSMVTESSRARFHPGYNPQTGENNIALISINRYIQTTDNIVPADVADVDAEVPSSATFYAYGANSDNGPGETLQCSGVDLEVSEDGTITASGDSQPTQFDDGAPLVVDGVQYGVLTDTENFVFTNPANYVSWMEAEFANP